MSMFGVFLPIFTLSGSFIWSVGVGLNVCNYMGQGAFSTVSLIGMVSSSFKGYCNTLLTLQWSRRSPHGGRHSLFSPVFPLHSLLQSGVLHEWNVINSDALNSITRHQTRECLRR